MQRLSTHMAVILAAAVGRTSGNDVRTLSLLQTMAVVVHEQSLMHTSRESAVTSPVMVLRCDRPFAGTDSSISSSSRPRPRHVFRVTARIMVLRHSSQRRRITSPRCRENQHLQNNGNNSMHEWRLSPKKLR